MFIKILLFTPTLGDNEVGQINRDSSNSSWCFNLLPVLQMIPVKLASCGKEHALILTMAGEVFSFGRGRYEPGSLIWLPYSIHLI